MPEFLISIAIFVLFAVFWLTPLVLSVLALRGMRQVGALQTRIAELERVAAAALPTAGEARAQSPRAAPDVQPPVATSAPARVVERAGVLGRKLSSFDWEWIIGRKALGWIAVLLVLFAAGFFVRYAIENQWVGPLGRVSLTAFLGIACVIGGGRASRKGRAIAFSMLTAAGTILLYLSIYGAFAYYHLLPRPAASVMLVLIVAESACAAVLADSVALGLCTILGGLITPMLLHSQVDPYMSFFLYLFALNLGSALMITLRPWQGPGSVALVGAQILFWAWYGEQFHPEKRAWALGFQAGITALYLGQALLLALLRRRVGWEDLARYLLTGGAGAIALYVLLRPDLEPWLGSLAIGLAILHVGVAQWLFQVRPAERGLLLTALALATGLLASVFAIQAQTSWIALGWAGESALLWWFGVRVRMPVLRGLAAGLMGLAVGRLIFVDLPSGPRSPYWPIFNDHALPALGIAACGLAALAATRRGVAGLGKLERGAAAAAEVAGVVLLWVILTLDLSGSFDSRRAPGLFRPEEWERLRQMSLSILWAVYATAVLGVGFLVHKPRLRWTALGILGLLVLKVFIVDMNGLNEMYRIAAFLVAAIMMGLAAAAYQRLRPDTVDARVPEGIHDVSN